MDIIDENCTLDEIAAYIRENGLDAAQRLIFLFIKQMTKQRYANEFGLDRPILLDRVIQCLIWVMEKHILVSQKIGAGFHPITPTRDWVAASIRHQDRTGIQYSLRMASVTDTVNDILGFFDFNAEVSVYKIDIKDRAKNSD